MSAVPEAPMIETSADSDIVTATTEKCRQCTRRKPPEGDRVCRTCAKSWAARQRGDA